MTADAPTIYLSNWSSHKTPGHHGPGRKWTIMVHPRHWERGEGSVRSLTPSWSDFDQVRRGQIGLNEYRHRFRSVRTHAWCYAPGRLMAQKTGASPAVSDGDTLCCACSRDRAARGECHRVWAAELLQKAGWRVVLDGVELNHAPDEGAATQGDHDD